MTDAIDPIEVKEECAHIWDVWKYLRDGYDPRGAVNMDGRYVNYKSKCRVMGCKAVRYVLNVEPDGPVIIKGADPDEDT